MIPPKPLNKHCDLTFAGDKCPKCGTEMCRKANNMDKTNLGVENGKE